MFTIEWDKYNKDKILGNWRRKELNVSWQVKDGFAAEEIDRLCLNDYTCAFCMEKANDKDVELEIADIHWIIEKAREFQENKQTNYSCFINYTKTFNYVGTQQIVENS